MLTALRRTVVVAAASLALAISPSLAAAQDAATCSVDLYKPNQLAQAQILIQQAAGSPEGEAGAKALKDAGRLLQNERPFATNPLGLAFTRAQIYILWLHQDNPKDRMTAYEMGLGRDRNTQIDLVAAADSLLSLVEAQGTACEGETDRWRQSKPWSTRIGHAYRNLEAGNVDSAEYWAKEAFRLDRRSPFIYNAFAQIAARRNDGAGLRENLEKAIERADLDTALVETARQLRTQYATSLQEAALSEPDAAKKKEMLLTAGRTFLMVGQADPSGVDGPAYISAALDIAMVAQDQEFVAEIIGPMLEDPIPYPDLALLLGAETSRMLNKKDDAITLYKAALEKNPNIRDANYFLAFLYLDANQPALATPLLDKLVEVDPSNPDNLMMRTMAMRLVAEAERDPAKRREAIRAVTALETQEAGMAHRLSITRFERRPEGAVFRADIENRSRASKTYTVEVSFLDLDGNVVETLSATSEPAAAGATVSVEVTATKPGIVAYRYTPLR
jgi:tetratricopeptide (TPR) repeat protein